MARRAFFSFHYERDIWRANVVRMSWVTKEREAAGFWDSSLWEEAKKKGDDAIKRMINEGLKGTSVTVVLIGKETANREWVKYEISQSHKACNGLLGVYIHNIKDQNENTDVQGSNSFGMLEENELGLSGYFWQLYPTYDWKNENGYSNLGDWIEKAAKKAGK